MALHMQTFLIYPHVSFAVFLSYKQNMWIDKMPYTHGIKMVPTQNVPFAKQPDFLRPYTRDMTVIVSTKNGLTKLLMSDPLT